MRKQDVIVEGGVTYLQITDDPEAGKTVKTRNSVRRVPVHEQLMQDGFAEWIASRPEDQLFSFASSVASKRLLRRFKAAGLGDGKVAHSLRHTFIGAARRVMEEDWRERITGHKSQRVSRTYVTMRT
jgi:integrase